MHSIGPHGIRRCVHIPSFLRWAQALPQLAQSQETLDELPYWQNDEPAASLPTDYPRAGQLDLNPATQSLTLSAAKSAQLLVQTAESLHTTAEGLLLSALAWSISRLIGPRTFALEMEHHGRASQRHHGRLLLCSLGWPNPAAILGDLSLRHVCPAGLRAENRRPDRR